MDRPGALEPELVVYPESDGRPMAESDHHQAEMIRILDVLRTHFQAAAEPTYVAGNNFLYWRRGDPRAVVSPDAYVVKGADPRLRPTFKVWEEGGLRPCAVLEVTSSSTRHEDLGAKMSRYRDDLRVPEYFLFDLTGDWIPELLRGYRLERGVYQALEPLPSGRLSSRELGLELGMADGHLGFYLPGSDTPLPTLAEAHARRADENARRADENARRADENARRADAAEAELARLRALLERRGENEA